MCNPFDMQFEPVLRFFFSSKKIKLSGRQGRIQDFQMGGGGGGGHKKFVLVAHIKSVKSPAGVARSMEALRF